MTSHLPVDPSLIPADTEATRFGVGVSTRALGRRFGKRTVLHGLDVDIAAGDFVSIVGRSGCGKSTLFRLLAGLDQPDDGNLTLLGTQDPRGDTRIMFQEARLLPWKHVLDNVGIGLRGDWKDAALEALAQVGLEDRAYEWPGVLSGGQRQRVALARALVHKPRLLLLDEPFGALDALTRIEMQQLVHRLWQQHRFTALLVTHDVSEALVLSDRVLLLESGKISHDEQLQIGHPRDRASAEFARKEGEIVQRILRTAPSHANIAGARHVA